LKVRRRGWRDHSEEGDCGRECNPVHWREGLNYGWKKVGVAGGRTYREKCPSLEKA